MKKLLRLGLVLGAVGLTVGCAPNRTAVSGAPVVPMEVAEGGGVRVTRTGVHQERGSLVVTGRVLRLFPSPVRGHVDVAVFDAAGRLVTAASAEAFAHRSRRGGRQEDSFTVRLPGPLPDGAQVTVRYHAKGAHGDGTPACGGRVGAAES